LTRRASISSASPESARRRKAFLYTHLEDPAQTAKIQGAVSRAGHRAQLDAAHVHLAEHHQGGFRSNVIPGDSEATLDVRALPDEDMEAFLSTLRAVIDDPAVEIIPQWGEDARPVTPPSRLDTEMFLTLERGPEADVSQSYHAATMLTGATDSGANFAPRACKPTAGSLAPKKTPIAFTATRAPVHQRLAAVPRIPPLGGAGCRRCEMTSDSRAQIVIFSAC